MAGAMGGTTGPPAGVATVVELLLRVAQLADTVPEIAEMVLDPVVAGPETATAESVRVRLATRPERTAPASLGRFS